MNCIIERKVYYLYNRTREKEREKTIEARNKESKLFIKQIFLFYFKSQNLLFFCHSIPELSEIRLRKVIVYPMLLFSLTICIREQD